MKCLLLAALVALSTAFQLPAVGLRPQRAARALAPVLEEDYTKGISPVLGGGRKTGEGDSDISGFAEPASKVAFALVFCGFVFAAVNPDAVDDIAKSQRKPCDPAKIINGKRVVCKEVASITTSNVFPMA